MYHCLGSTASCKMVDKLSKLYEISSLERVGDEFPFWLAPGFNFFFPRMRFLEEVSILRDAFFNVMIGWMGCKCLQNIILPD